LRRGINASSLACGIRSFTTSEGYIHNQSAIFDFHSLTEADIASSKQEWAFDHIRLSIEAWAPDGQRKLMPAKLPAD